MKKLWIFLALMMCSLAFVACGDDDTGADDPGKTGEGNGKFSAEMFIGTWDGHGTWTFNADGTCVYEYFSTYDGHWAYDEETQTLITDVLEWNWEIINVSEDWWTGTHLAGTKETYTYTRIE